MRARSCSIPTTQRSRRNFSKTRSRCHFLGTGNTLKPSWLGEIANGVILTANASALFADRITGAPCGQSGRFNARELVPQRPDLSAKASNHDVPTVCEGIETVPPPVQSREFCPEA